MKPIGLQDDLKAEVALILCEIKEDKIIDMFTRGYLKFYTVRIILNQIQSNTSPFYKKYRGDYNIDVNDFLKYGIWDNLEHSDTDNNRLINVTGLIESEADSYDTRKDQAIEEIETLYWYDREILKLYGKLGTYRAIEEETGIPFESIYKTVQKACKEIRKKVA